MSKLAWYVVIMAAIDVLLCIARFCERAAKSARTADVPPEGSTSQEAESSASSVDGFPSLPSA